jgi:branched-chain amino acid transport system substrate-binding protein
MFGLALLASGCGGGSIPQPIYVGHVATLSGPDKPAGEQAARAIRLAVQEQTRSATENKTRPIVVRHTDTKGKLDGFEAEAVRLVTINRVVALLGGSSAEEIARLDKAQVPLVTAGPRTRGASELVFFVGLPSIFQGQVLARFAVENLQATRTVVMADERREDALALAEAFTRELRQAAAKQNPKHPANVVTWRFGKDLPVSDWTKRLGQEKPQALLWVGEARDLIRVKRELQFTGPVLFGGDEGAGRQFLDSGEATGTYLVTAFVNDLDLPRTKEFIAGYRKAYNEDPDVHAALAYDSARLLFEAITQCPAGSGVEAMSKEIAKQLVKLKDYASLTGPVAFAADRQLLRPAFIVQVDNKGLRNVRRFPPGE